MRSERETSPWVMLQSTRYHIYIGCIFKADPKRSSQTNTTSTTSRHLISRIGIYVRQKIGGSHMVREFRDALAPLALASTSGRVSSTPSRVLKRSSAKTTTTSTLSLSILSSRVTRHTSQSFECTQLQNKEVAMSDSNPSPIPTSSTSQSLPHQPTSNSPPTSASSLSSIDSQRSPSKLDSPSRPKMSSRKSSGTIIVPRDDPNIEIREGDETFDADDARAMSPRRTSEDLEKMGQDARRQLSQSVQPYNLGM
jgi:hypothetical protein